MVNIILDPIFLFIFKWGMTGAAIATVLGQALTSTMLSMVRELIFGVGFALLLPRFWGLAGVMYSMPVSDVLTFFISCVCIYRTYKALSNPEKLLKTA